MTDKEEIAELRKQVEVLREELNKTVHGHNYRLQRLESMAIDHRQTLEILVRVARDIYNAVKGISDLVLVGKRSVVIDDYEDDFKKMAENLEREIGT